MQGNFLVFPNEKAKMGKDGKVLIPMPTKYIDKPISIVVESYFYKKMDFDAPQSGLSQMQLFLNKIIRGIRCPDV
jgi:hypothetical protein